MYLSHYNLSDKPFQISTDPRFLWLGGDHKEALANLRYGLLESNGFVVLVGPVGTGKTTLVNALLQSLDDRVLVANVNYPSLGAAEFLSFVARTYDPAAQVNSKADCLIFLKAFLERAHEEGKSVLLVIDEAHRLSEELLEEIRLLSNMERDGKKLIDIFFVGQTELKRRLLSSHCRALRQRITLFYHLKPLSEVETMQYITHRLKVAGCASQPFTLRAVHAVYKFSRGYPRLINKLCDRALLTGFVKEQTEIDASIIIECAREITLIDPIPTAIPAVQRLPRPQQKGWERIRLGMAALNMANHLSVKLKRIGKSMASTAITIGAAARKQTQAAREIIRVRVQKKGRQAIMVGSALAMVLIGSAWMAGILWRQTAATETRTAENPSRVADEAYLPASFSPSATVPPDVAPKPLQPSGRVASPPSSATAPAKPAMAERAAAMLAKRNYQAVIQLIEAEGGRTTTSRPEVDALYARALVGRAAQLKAQSPKKAEVLLRKAVRAGPRNIEVLVALGNHYTRAKAHTLAIDTYHKALELDPQRADVLFNLGFIFATTGMYPSAEETLTRVVQLKPDYADKALFNLAVVQQKLGKRQESQASLEAAVALRPDNQQAQAYLKDLKAADEDRP